MGMPMLGGPISTAGNVLFIAATADNYLRAYNMSNGEKLWQGRLPAGGQATPMTYEVNGKQYVVISDVYKRQRWNLAPKNDDATLA